MPSPDPAKPAQAGQTPAKPLPIRGSMLSFQAFGVPIRFHFTFVLLVIFLVVFGAGGDQSPVDYAIYIAALFASVIVHELGHAIVARQFGIHTIEIVLFPIGGLSRLETNPKPKQEFWIALAGPFVNVCIAAALFGLLIAEQQIVAVKALLQPTHGNLIERIAAANLILAAFNLVPAYPMDGGRILRAVLARFKSPDEASSTAAFVGRMLAIAAGLYGLLTSNFMLVFIAFFVYLGAEAEGSAASGRLLTHGIPVKAAMLSEYHTLTHGSTFRDAANLMLATSQQDFPVVHGTQVIGLLTRNTMLRGIATQGAEAYVAATMDREFPTVSPDLDLAEALSVVERPGSCALVMQDGQLLGLLTSENLSQFLLLRRFGMKPAA